MHSLNKQRDLNFDFYWLFACVFCWLYTTYVGHSVNGKYCNFSTISYGEHFTKLIIEIAEERTYSFICF